MITVAPYGWAIGSGVLESMEDEGVRHLSEVGFDCGVTTSPTWNALVSFLVAVWHAACVAHLSWRLYMVCPEDG